MFSRFSLICLLMAPAALSQSTAESSELAGAVTDPSSAAAGGVKVTLRNKSTGLSREVTTGADGQYRIQQIPPGSYEMRFEKDAFQTQVVNDVRLTVGQLGRLDVQLALGARTEVLQVDSAVGLVEPERTSQANTLEREFVQNLPIDRRD